MTRVEVRLRLEGFFLGVAVGVSIVSGAGGLGIDFWREEEVTSGCQVTAKISKS